MRNKHVFCQISVTHANFHYHLPPTIKKMNEFKIIEVERINL